MTWQAVLLLVLSTFSIFNAQDLNYRDVRISQGVVRGYQLQEENIVAFYGIPYATTPTGPDFYKGPLPPPTWNETFEATDNNIKCPQPSWNSDEFQEQCLIANVMVPDKVTQNLPVVVFVHGGGFLFGCGNDDQPRSLVKTGRVMAVTFNYRLGPQGFLCLGTDVAPGNAAMKDQVALLRWVQENIAKFGGNPNDVTIAGCSAGSSSVDLLMISKLAKGLFHKVIAGSGANVNPFSVQIEPLENAKLFAKQVGFNNTDDIAALEKFYLETPYDVILLNSVNLMSRTDSVTLFSPCIERDIGQEIFLDEVPEKIIRNGEYVKTPMLYGYTEMEGLFRIHQFYAWKTKMNENFIEFLPPNLGNSEEERQTLANDIKRFYFGDEMVSNSTILKYVDFFTDVMFGYSMLRSAKLQLEAGNEQLYLYEYSFVDESVPYIPHTQIRGATHCDQFEAVLNLPNEKELSEEFKRMKVVMRELWLNFIINGVPVAEGSSYPSWPPMSPERSYMSLNSTLQYKDSLTPERAKFWDNIWEKYAKHPSPPNPNSGSTFLTNNSLLSLVVFVTYSVYMLKS